MIGENIGFDYAQPADTDSWYAQPADTDSWYAQSAYTDSWT